MNNIHKAFALKRLGKLQFLGIEFITQKSGSIFLTQAKYIKDFLNRENM